MPESPSSPLGDRLAAALSDDYEIIRLLGRGGMASVFLARERALNRHVALKVIDPELGEGPIFRARFQREAETVAQLQHPNIVPIYRVGEADGLAFYAMAFVEGENLAQRLRREGRLAPGEAVRICGEILGALGAAHKRGIIHRDIKPENVLIERETGRAMVTDFGIARIVAAEAGPGGEGEKLTAVGMAMGTPRYMSPEQASGERELTAASDIYALGILFYEMLSGSYPYEVKEGRSALVAHLTHPVIPLNKRVQGLPSDIESAVERMLARNPEARFASADAAAEALGVGGATPTGPLTAVRRRWGSKRWAVISAVAGIAAVVVGALLLGGRSDRPPAGVDPRQSILIGFFDNTRQDPTLEWLRFGGVELLGRSLARWQDLQVVEPERLLDLARRENVAEAEPLSSGDAIRLAEVAGVWTATVGSVLKLGEDIQLTVNVYDVASGKRLSTAAATADSDSTLASAFDSLANQLLDVAGAPRAALIDVEPPTRSIDAYRAYIRGLEANSRWNLSTAQREFQRAVELDSTFALAYYELTAVTAFFEQTSPTPTFIALADSALRYASQRPPKERLLIQAFHAYINTDFVRSRSLYRELLALDSTVVDAWTGLAGSSLMDLTLTRDSAGREYFPSSPGLALKSLERAMALDSSDYGVYPAVSNLLLLASQDESRGLPAFPEPPPGAINTIGRQGPPVRWFRVLYVGDSLITVPEDSVAVRYSQAVLDSLRSRARLLSRAHLRRWIRLAPDQGQPYFFLANNLAVDRQFDSALVAMARAEELGADSPVPISLVRLGWQLEGQLFEKAKAHGDSLLAQPPWTGALPPGLAVVSGPVANYLLLRGRVTEAGRLSDERYTASKQFVPTPEGLARIERATLSARLRAAASIDAVSPGFYRATLDSLAVLLEAFPDSEHVEIRKSLRWPVLLGAATLGDTAQVRAWRTLADEDRDTGIDAWAAMVAGDRALAERRYLAAKSDSSDVPVHVSSMARTAEALGRLDEAIAYYTQMDTLRYTAQVQAGPDADWLLLVRSYAARAAVYEALGDRDRALEFYQRFLSLWDKPDALLIPERDRARRAVGELERADRGDRPTR